MNHNTTCTLDLIESFRKSIADAVKESANCKFALAEAEMAADHAIRDDGETPPEVIYARGEESRRTLFVKKTEAKRASDKLETLESDFKESVQRDPGAVIAALEAKTQVAIGSLLKQLSPLISKGDSYAMAALEAFIQRCDDIAERQAALRVLRVQHNAAAHHGRYPDSFVITMEWALKLL